jgi:hypothetical protein
MKRNLLYILYLFLSMADSVTVPFQIFSGRAADRREISTSRAGVIGWGYSCVSNVSVWNQKQMVI